ncbi:MAG: hypothetical protein JW909_12005 [Planctomycetes bacterium]|nr:hypothetical protein [Planctomycetota bacterium]
MAKEVRVGFLQNNPEILNTKSNTRRIVELLDEVQDALIVLPELATTGYAFENKYEVAEAAEPADVARSPVLEAIADKAARNSLHVVIGFPELSGELIYNSAVLIGPSGLQALYRKIHLFDREKLFFTPGDAPPPVIDVTGYGRIGIMICYDWYFPETARSLAFRGADMIAHPANLVLPWCLDAMKTRSLENRVFSITANRCGTESHGGRTIRFYGRSQVLSPDGNVLAVADDAQEEIRVVTIDPATARDKAISQRNPGMCEVRRRLLPLE